MLVKKYGNRRLYDTESSRYVTLEELTVKIKEGAEVRVVDAKTGDDLTQPTLTQIIFESRGARNLLPTILLHQLIRLQDDVLADFLGRYVPGALELYILAKRGSQSLRPFNPFASLLQAAQHLPRNPWTSAAIEEAPAPVVVPGKTQAEEIEDLRRELEALKRSLRKRPRS
jgi:polyhydroxyalkanoate synthesis repressor PhaR